MILGRNTALIEMPVSWSPDDHPLFEMTSNRPGYRNANRVMKNWLDDFLYMTRCTDWGIITYSCHSYVIGRGHLIMMLERLIAKLQDLGAEFMHMEDATRLYNERKPIRENFEFLYEELRFSK